ncbi:MAG: RsmD family RNA methyltransferase [Opitutales bacterium]
MRITGGKARGIPLKAPKGDATRPATDRIREAVFSSLGAGVEGRTVADLFAGTGSYGLEALSRGAASCAFYEKDRIALDCLKANARAVLRSVGLKNEILRIEKRDVYAPGMPERAFDLIFLDPPYAQIEQSFERLFDEVVSRLATPDARVLLELPGNLNPDVPGWTLVHRIGKAGRNKPTVAIFERSS